MMLLIIEMNKKHQINMANTLDLRWCYLIGRMRNSRKRSGSASSMMVPVKGKYGTMQFTITQFMKLITLMVKRINLQLISYLRTCYTLVPI